MYTLTQLKKEKKTRANVTLGIKLEVFPLRSGTKKGHTLSFQKCIGSLS
jgi:hypothetical protein